MAKLIETPASQIKTGDRVCGDYGVTFTVAGVHKASNAVFVHWHTGKACQVAPSHIFHREAA